MIRTTLLSFKTRSKTHRAAGTAGAADEMPQKARKNPRYTRKCIVEDFGSYKVETLR
jgi:hypothetical protein